MDVKVSIKTKQYLEGEPLIQKGKSEFKGLMENFDGKTELDHVISTIRMALLAVGYMEDSINEYIKEV